MRKIIETEGKTFQIPLKTNAVIEYGEMVAIDDNGDAVKASDTSGLTVVGVKCLTMEDEEYVTVKRGVFAMDNDGTDDVGAGDVGADVYVKNEHTVADDTTNSIVAGTLVFFEGATPFIKIGV